MRDPVQETPPGYVVHQVADVTMVFDRQDCADLVRLQLADPAVRKALFARAPRRGRGTVPSVPLQPDRHMVLRRYRHGGLLGWLTGPLYLGTSRAVDELRVTAAAEASGAPVPHVLCVVLWPVVGPFWSAVIGTREERNAGELLELLRSLEDGRARRSLLREVGAAVRRLHDAGVDHRDLQLRNLLVVHENENRRIVVVDLDRAVFHAHGMLPISRRAENLGRLARSAIKTGVWAERIGRREIAAFVGAYTRGNRELRNELRGWIRRERFKIALHRLGYGASRLSGSTAAASPLRSA